MRVKKLVLFLLALSFAFVLAACQTTTTTTTTATTSTSATTTQTTTTTSTATTTVSMNQTLSILNGWTDSGDAVNQITQSASQLSVTYDKNSFSWASMVHNIDQNLSVFNKLVFTVSGSGTLMVKIQGASDAVEVSIQLTAGVVTYQINLRDYDEFLSGVTAVYIFPAPGKAVGTGNFTMTKFEFDEGTAFGTVLEDGDSNIPQNEQEYDGTGDTFDFSNGFVDNGDGIYEIDKTGDNPIVTYTKAAGFEWAYMISTVRGNFSDFDYVVLTVRGVTAGSVLLKAELSSSVQKEISGTFGIDEEITLCLDLTDWTNEQLDALTKILIFAAGGSASASGEFEIVGAYFSKVYVGDIIEEPNYNFLTGWVENDASTYAFSTTVDDTLLVSYTKAAGQSWVFMKNEFDLVAAAGFNTMTFTVKGTAGLSILIKPNDSGALEQTITFTGDEQTVTIFAYAFTKMLIFAEPGTESVSGTFEIISAKLTYVEQASLDASVVYDVNGGWVDNDGGIYTFTTVDGIVTVDYTKTAGQEWAFIKNIFLDNLANHDTIELVVKGTAGVQLIIKPNDNGAYEQTVTFTGEVQVITFTLTDAPEKILIFVDPLIGGLTGSFQIISAKVLSSNSGVYNFTKDFAENDLGTYDFTILGGGSVQVDYTKVAGQEWAFMRATFLPADVTGLNTMTLVLKGTLGKTILVKPNDNGAFEQTVTFTGDVQTVVFTVPSFSNVIIFAEPNTVDVTGSFTIISATLSYIEPHYDFLDGWTENDANTYAFSTSGSGSLLVDYTKGVGQEWAFMRNNFTAGATGFNTLTMVVKGTVGNQILIKPNDNGALEQYITFTGLEQTVVITAPSFTFMIMFAMPNVASVSGQFEIISANLTYVQPDAVDPWVDVTLGNNWIDNDGGIYTFTNNAGAITVDYTKTAGQEWAFIKYMFDQNLSRHDTLTMVVSGTAGAHLIIKPNDNGAYEQNVTLTGSNQTLTFTLTDTLTKILIFVDPDGALTGSFVIVSAVVSSTMDTIDFTNSFTENDPGTYAFTLETNLSVTVAYTKGVGQEWAFMRATFDAEKAAGMNTMTLVVQGTAGKTILLKPNDSGALEQSVTFTGAEQTIVITADSFAQMIIFAEQGTASVSGTFTIISATLSHVMPS